jgi:hypothetical protein
VAIRRVSLQPQKDLPRYIPAHPTSEQVQAEYEKVWQNLDGRPIESLIDLPLITDPDRKAAVEMMTVCSLPLSSPTFAYFACSCAES